MVLILLCLVSACKSRDCKRYEKAFSSTYLYPQIPTDSNSFEWQVLHLPKNERVVYSNTLLLQETCMQQLPSYVLRMECDAICINATECMNTKQVIKDLCKVKGLYHLRIGTHPYPRKVEKDSFKVLLKKMPVNIQKLSNLTGLSLEGNDLRRLPNGLKHLQSLQILDISYNPHINIHQSFKQISHLKNLEYLHLNGLNLKTIPLDILKCKKLKYLCLYRNPSLTSLPSELSNLDSLKLIEGIGDRKSEMNIPECIKDKILLY